MKIVTSTILDGNMSYKFGAREEVERNHERFFRKHAIYPNRVVYMQQVHGDRIGVVKRPQTRKKTDGLITSTPNLWLAIYHADCIPLFLITDRTLRVIGSVIAVAHVGWRGVIKGLPAKMVHEMVKHFKVDPKDIAVKFGPFICQDHYDVKLDDERLKLLPHEIRGGRAYLDLRQAVIDQLVKSGLPSSIFHSLSSDLCTAEHPDKYWSYHRPRENLGGVMLSVIGFQNQ